MVELPEGMSNVPGISWHFLAVCFRYMLLNPAADKAYLGAPDFEVKRRHTETRLALEELKHA